MFAAEEVFGQRLESLHVLEGEFALPNGRQPPPQGRSEIGGRAGISEMLVPQCLRSINQLHVSALGLSLDKVRSKKMYVLGALCVACYFLKTSGGPLTRFA
jgi:hypothetical protein